LKSKIECSCSHVNIHVHYPAFRDRKPTVNELVDAISLHITPFALPRSEVAKVDAKYGKVSVQEFKDATSLINAEAIDLFIKANKATNRSGEAGELLLYILTEWILDAPQIVAKMSLKTNPKMPVYGSDGVHVRFCSETSRLFIYWGESKFHQSITGAISSAAESIKKALLPDEAKHEINLVKRNIDFSGLKSDAKDAILKYLDPMDEDYNERVDVVTCIIGFDFKGFSALTATDPDAAEAEFCSLAEERLKKVAPTLASALEAQGLETQRLEMFFLPLPDVGAFRDAFQAKIGWPA